MFQELVNQLRDPDPARRIHTLQVLAMLDETRALNAIHYVFKNDSDQRVRQAAKWAGNLIWQAQQRGYNTEKALEEHIAGQLSDKQREAMLANLIIPVGDDRSLKAEMDSLQTKWQHIDAVKQGWEPPPTPPAQIPARTDDFDLLDAGLSVDQPQNIDLDELDAGLSDLFK